MSDIHWNKLKVDDLLLPQNIKTIGFQWLTLIYIYIQSLPLPYMGRRKRGPMGMDYVICSTRTKKKHIPWFADGHTLNTWATFCYSVKTKQNTKVILNVEWICFLARDQHAEAISVLKHTMISLHLSPCLSYFLCLGPSLLTFPHFPRHSLIVSFPGSASTLLCPCLYLPSVLFSMLLPRIRTCWHDSTHNCCLK